MGGCKDELALGGTHTYNPPHRKWCRRRCRRLLQLPRVPGPVGWVRVPPISSKTQVGWLGCGLGAVAVFPEYLRSDPNEDESSDAIAGVG